ncbi:MAG: EscN/YscN/HrcN family type III secretion system ATPase, partial [Deltaproteobacteria bacterium]|nr:EscN/YscN/HrcN family type III secretion system ATPase [Deltaproteobacteria bacterium]
MELAALVEGLPSPPVARTEGQVLGARGLAVTLSLPGARIGDAVRLHRRGPPLVAEIRAFHGAECVALPFGDLTGL